MNEKDTYFVAVKIFLEDKEGHLLIIKDRFGDWDLPGGRIRVQDFNTPLPDIISRKIKEELGEEIEYELGEQKIFMRHERNEVLPNEERELRRIFAIGYITKYKGGEINLGNNHELYEWVNPKKFNPEEYFIGGWLDGVKEYQKLGFSVKDK